MGNLVETNTFTPTITQIEVTDFVEGGENGIDNKPHIELANRTIWLKTAIDAFVSGAMKVKKAILADTATKLATPRYINGIAFDGSDDIQLPALPLFGYNSNATLTQDQSGSIINYYGSSDATFTLPVIKNGSYFVFINQSNYNMTIQTPDSAKFYGVCSTASNTVVIYPGCILEIGNDGNNWLGLSMDYAWTKGYMNGDNWWEKTATFIQGVGVVAWIKQGSVVGAGTSTDTVINLPIAFSSVFQSIYGNDIGNVAVSFGFNRFGSLSQFKLTGKDYNGNMNNYGCRYIAEGY